MQTKLVVFKNKEIRRTLHNNEWWFVVEDVLLALIDAKDMKQYIQRMKQRDPEQSRGSQGRENRRRCAGEIGNRNRGQGGFFGKLPR